MLCGGPGAAAAPPRDRASADPADSPSRGCLEDSAPPPSPPPAPPGQPSRAPQPQVARSRGRRGGSRREALRRRRGAGAGAGGARARPAQPRRPPGRRASERAGVGWRGNVPGGARRHGAGRAPLLVGGAGHRALLLALLHRLLPAGLRDRVGQQKKKHPDDGQRIRAASLRGGLRAQHPVPPPWAPRDLGEDAASGEPLGGNGPGPRVPRLPHFVDGKGEVGSFQPEDSHAPSSLGMICPGSYTCVASEF
ncbi:collagen alpha-1(III) chain-like [Dipodomys merriami]|uniref:collagen alpha-1(III) chain-like n=1 Tax=Dipodomys merriami TaxID=94247 RepID=UPI0038559DB4